MPNKTTYLFFLIAYIILIAIIPANVANARPVRVAQDKEEEDLSMLGINGFEPARKNSTNFCGDYYCPAPYRCWVASGFNIPLFCHHPDFNPTADNRDCGAGLEKWVWACGGMALLLCLATIATLTYLLVRNRQELREVKKKVEEIPVKVVAEQAKQVGIIENSRHLPFQLQEREEVDANRVGDFLDFPTPMLKIYFYYFCRSRCR
jgi:hypothetical protein